MQHVQYCLGLLCTTLPAQYASADVQRMTLAYFALASLRVLGHAEALPDTARRGIADWVYRCAMWEPCGEGEGLDAEAWESLFGGAAGGNDGEGGERQRAEEAGLPRGGRRRCRGFAGFPAGPQATAAGIASGHAAMTYAAICVLALVGDDLRRLRALLHAGGLRDWLASLQVQGRGSATGAGGVASNAVDVADVDLRYVYSAAAALALLAKVAARGRREEEEGGASGAAAGDEGSVPALCPSSALGFIGSCQAFDGGLALSPGCGEGHGGSTYCGAAAAALLARQGGCYGGQQRRSSSSGCGGNSSDSCDSCSSCSGGASPPPLDVPALHRWLVMRQTNVPAPSLAGEGDGGSNSSTDDDSSPNYCLYGCVSRVPEAFEASVAGGMSGRPGKPCDACYSFWVVAAAKALAAAGTSDASSVLAPPAAAAFVAAAAALPPSVTLPLDAGALRRSLLACATPSPSGRRGGFGKDSEAFPDPMHTYYALCGLAWCDARDGSGASAAAVGVPTLTPPHPLLGIPLPEGWE